MTYYIGQIEDDLGKEFDYNWRSMADEIQKLRDELDDAGKELDDANNKIEQLEDELKEK